MRNMATQGEARLRYEPALDGLRAIAVVAVVLYHLQYHWMQGGFLGVDMFFALSGYLITSLLLEEWDRSLGISLGSFWSRRGRRLLPALFLVLGAVAVFAALRLPHDELGRIRGDGLAALAYVANWRLVITRQSYFDLFSQVSPLRHLWSLAIEEQFYLVWPLIVMLCLRIGRGSRRLLAVVCASGIIASVAAMAFFYDARDPSRAYYGTDTRAHTLLVGASLALLLRSRKRSARLASRVAIMAGPLAAVACAAAFVLVPEGSSRFYQGGSLTFACATAAVVAAAVHDERSRLRRLLSREPLGWIGRRSYGIYLWHWPVIIFVTADRTGLHGIALDGVRVGIIAAAAAASFALVEQPIRRGVLSSRLQAVLAPTGFAVVAVTLLISTTAAAPPPVYLRGERAVATPTPAPLVKPRVPGMPRVYLMGDSVAFSLLFALGSALDHGMGAAYAGEPHVACGMVDGLPVDSHDKPLWFAPQCERTVLPEQRRVALERRPDVFVWLSIWETWDRVINGKLRHVGTPDGDAALLRSISRTVGRLRTRGAHVAILTVSPSAPGAIVRSDQPPPEHFEHLNILLRAYARGHPTEVSVIDLHSLVCPRGAPCPKRVDGLQLRPDGTHFGSEGSKWIGERLAPVIVECWRHPLQPRCSGGSLRP